MSCASMKHVQNSHIHYKVIRTFCLINFHARILTGSITLIKFKFHRKQYCLTRKNLNRFLELCCRCIKNK